MFSRLWRIVASIVVALAVLWPTSFADALPTRVQGIAPPPPHPTGIVINIPALTLYWYKDGQLVRTFPISTGKPATPTPVGSYSVIVMAKNPWWQPPWGGPVVPPGPDNALSTRWMEFFDGNGMHGTPWPDSIGAWGSYGCVRMYTPDVEWLYDQVQQGTPVTVQYEPVQIQMGADGRRYLAVYQDPYGRGMPSVDAVLGAAGLHPDTPASKSQGLYPLDAKVLVHGGWIDAVLNRGSHYIAARALAAEMSAELAWNNDRQSVSLDEVELPTVVRNGKGYVEANAAVKVLKIDSDWDSTTNTLSLKGRPVILDGKVIARTGADVAGETYLPVRAVAEAMGAKVDWDPVHEQALINGASIQTLLLRDRSYTPVSVLSERLHLKAERVGQAIILHR